MESKERLFNEFPEISKEQWMEKVTADLKGADFDRKLVWKTMEGFAVQPFYSKEDIQGISHLDALPNAFPYVRGTKDKGNAWEIREDFEVKDPSEANKLVLQALQRGANTIGVHLTKHFEINEIKQLLEGIELSAAPVHFSGSFSYSVLITQLKEILEERGTDPISFKGSFNFDSLGYYLKNGAYYNSHSDNINELSCLIDQAKEELPGLSILNINADIFHNAGASIVQELAYALSAGNEYLVELTEKGKKIEDILPRMRFQFAIGSSYFMEIAKFRAFRMLWSKIVEAYASDKPDLAKTFVHATNSKWNKSIYDPYVNMLRVTTESMSAALAGVDSISVLPFNQIYQDSDKFSKRIARNTQIILKEESYFDKITDPAAGSYYIETLTDSLASSAWKEFQAIEEKGGFIKAMEEAYIKEKIEETANERDAAIAKRKISILGTNQFPNTGENVLEEIRKADAGQSYLKQYRGAEAFEHMRLATEKHIANGGKKPVVFLLTIGNLGMRKARATFAANFFGCAGYFVTDNNGFASIEEGMEAAKKTGADIIVLCSSDEEYAEFGPQSMKFIQNMNMESQLVIAGYPKDLLESLQNAGIEYFIHVRSNVLETLENFQKIFGIL